MPSSKRSTVVSLTKTKKTKNATRENASQAKSLLIESVRQLAEQKEVHIYVLEVHNQRNALLKNARDKLKPGR